MRTFPTPLVFTSISGEVMETAGDQIVVFSSSAYARVGIHAFDDRVGVALGLQAPRNSRHHAECYKMPHFM